MHFCTHIQHVYFNLIPVFRQMLLGALRPKKLHRSPDAPWQSDLDEIDGEMGLEVEQDQIRQKAGLL